MLFANRHTKHIITWSQECTGIGCMHQMKPRQEV